MMVRNHQIDPQALQIGDLFLGRDTVIDGHDQIGLGEFVDAIERGARKAITLVKSVRDKRCDIGAKRPQCLGQQTSRRNAVDVKITKDGDAFAVANGALDTIGNNRHARNDERIGPITVERRRQK